MSASGDDGRLLAFLATAGLVGVSVLRGRGSSAAKKKTASPPPSTGSTFPVPGISATHEGPLLVRAIEPERGGDLKFFVRPPQNQSSTVSAQQKKNGFTKVLGPESHDRVWSFPDFPGWLLFDTEPMKGMHGYVPDKTSPSEPAAWWLLLHGTSGLEANWSSTAADLLSMVVLMEATIPGLGTRKIEKIRKDRSFSSQESSLLEAMFRRYEANSSEENDRVSASILASWQAEHRLLPPPEWRIKNYRGPIDTISLAYAIPGDPWALDWVWPEASSARPGQAIRKKLRRSRVPVGRRSALTLEGIFDPTSGFMWKIRGAFEFFGSSQEGKLTIDDTLGFPQSSWGSTELEKGHPLFQTGAGWKAAVGFGWTFMRLVALLGGDRMDERSREIRAVLRKMLKDEGRDAWRTWYELSLGDHRSETRVIEQQHEVRSQLASRRDRPDGFVSRMSQGRVAVQRLPVEVPSYEAVLEELVEKANAALGVGAEEAEVQIATHTPILSPAPLTRRPRSRRRIADKVVSLGPTGRVAVEAIRYQGDDPTWWLLDEQGEPFEDLGPKKPTSKQLGSRR